jgi:hypothetical protein
MEKSHKIELSVEKGIKIQNEHLARWKTVLSEKVYNELVEWATSTNGEAMDGMDIRRGDDLINWVEDHSYILTRFRNK